MSVSESWGPCPRRHWMLGRVFLPWFCFGIRACCWPESLAKIFFIVARVVNFNVRLLTGLSGCFVKWRMSNFVNACDWFAEENVSRAFCFYCHQWFFRDITLSSASCVRLTPYRRVINNCSWISSTFVGRWVSCGLQFCSLSKSCVCGVSSCTSRCCCWLDDERSSFQKILK